MIRPKLGFPGNREIGKILLRHDLSVKVSFTDKWALHTRCMGASHKAKIEGVGYFFIGYQRVLSCLKVNNMTVLV